LWSSDSSQDSIEYTPPEDRVQVEVGVKVVKQSPTSRKTAKKEEEDTGSSLPTTQRDIGDVAEKKPGQSTPRAAPAALTRHTRAITAPAYTQSLVKKELSEKFPSLVANKHKAKAEKAPKPNMFKPAAAVEKPDLSQLVNAQKQKQIVPPATPKTIKPTPIPSLPDLASLALAKKANHRKTVAASSDTPKLKKHPMNAFLSLVGRTDLHVLPATPLPAKADSGPVTPKIEKPRSAKLAAPIDVRTLVADEGYGSAEKGQNTIAEHLPAFRCFASSRMLQNVTMDRALLDCSVDLIYPEEDAYQLTKTQQVKDALPAAEIYISEADVVLSPASGAIFYPLDSVYRLATLQQLDGSIEKVPHSRIILQAIQTLSRTLDNSRTLDKVVLVFEAFSRPHPVTGAVKPASEAFTPAVNRALKTLQDKIAEMRHAALAADGNGRDTALAEVEICYAGSAGQAAQLIRERVEPRFATHDSLGHVKLDSAMLALLPLNRLSAHVVVVQADSFGDFIALPVEERAEDYGHLFGQRRMVRLWS
jgi:hypothetical protein